MFLDFGFRHVNYHWSEHFHKLKLNMKVNSSKDCIREVLWFIIYEMPQKACERYGRVQIILHKVKWKRIYSCDGLCKKPKLYYTFDQCIFGPNSLKLVITCQNPNYTTSKTKFYYTFSDQSLAMTHNVV